MAADISFNCDPISFNDFLQLDIHVGFIDGFCAVFVDEYVLAVVGYIHFDFYPLKNGSQILIDLNTAGLFGLLLLYGQDIGIFELAVAKLKKITYPQACKYPNGNEQAKFVFSIPLEF